MPKVFTLFNNLSIVLLILKWGKKNHLGARVFLGFSKIINYSYMIESMKVK